MYGDAQLEVIDAIDYLGLQFSYSGSWQNCIKIRMFKARNAQGCLKHKLYHFTGLILDLLPW